MSLLKNRLHIVALAVSVLGGVALGGENFIHLSVQQIDNLGIKTGKLEVANQVPLFTAPAKVVVPSANEFVLTASQAGLVVKLNASVGDKVVKGQVLALVNSPELLSMQGNYLAAVGESKLATATYNREKTLHKEGIVSGRGEQEAFNVYNAALIQVHEKKQLLDIAGMTSADINQLETTGKLTSQINVRSPISGTVIERMVLAGTRVDSLAPLYRVANLDQLWLEINIPQEHINNIKIGDKVQLENSLVTAKISMLSQSVNPDNQSVIAKAIVSNNPASVRVGQKVTIKLLQTPNSEMYTLPDAAIAHNKGNAYIFVREQDGFKVAQVSLLGKLSDGSVISGNLFGNEDIAINNAAILKANWLGLGSDE